MFCANCGREIRYEAKFCPFCGKEIVTEKGENSAKTVVTMVDEKQ